MVVDIISASDRIANAKDPDTKKEAIQRLKNILKEKVSEFMSHCKRLKASHKDKGLDDKFDKIGKELEKLLVVSIDYTKAYIKHHKKEKNLTISFSIIYAIGVILLVLSGVWLFALTSLSIILKAGIFVASFFGLGYLFYETMDMFSSKYCLDSMAETKK